MQLTLVLLNIFFLFFIHLNFEMLTTFLALNDEYFFEYMTNRHLLKLIIEITVHLP